jgi:alpha-galactosidase
MIEHSGRLDRDSPIRFWEAAISKQGRFAAGVSVMIRRLDDAPSNLHATWAQLGLGGGSHAARSLWDGVALADSERLNVTLRAHGSAVWQMD